MGEREEMDHPPPLPKRLISAGYERHQAQGLKCMLILKEIVTTNLCCLVVRVKRCKGVP